jgi:hypothetical protein
MELVFQRVLASKPNPKEKLARLPPSSSNLQYRQGQRVGIAVKTLQAPTMAWLATVPYYTFSLGAQMYGVQDKVYIYRGQVTVVGETHIEYDINAFTG